MTTKTDNPAQVGQHVFEAAGLGKAPFRCVGFSEIVFNNGDGTTKAGGCCQYCFTGIRYACHILSSDGKRFHVGTDCVARTGDAGLIKQFKNRPEVRAAAKAKRDSKDAAIKAEWKVLISNQENRDKLAALPTLTQYHWQPNRLVALESAWNYQGAAGRARMIKWLKAALQTVVVAVETFHVSISPAVTLS